MNKGCIILLTGLPSSGKTTLAKYLFSKLNKENKVVHLDGDEFRKKYCKDLGFSNDDRIENMRRLAIKAEDFENNGNIVVCSFISPTKFHRSLVKALSSNFIEVHIHADIKTCMERDVKGLWEKAISGEIKEFTGYSSPYEEPINPDVICFTTQESVEESCQKIIECLIEKKII